MTAVAHDWTRRRWRRLMTLGALALTVAAGTLAATAGAAVARPAFGVSEDASKYADDGGHQVYGDLRDLGMGVNRWTARFTGDPSVIAEQSFLDRATPVAQERGVRIVLSLFQERAAAPDPAAFCAWAETVARRYPTIRELVIGNEVNATRFWAPQRTDTDADAGPRSYYAVLSTCYDRLKAVDPGIRVIGMALAPRAVDRNSTKPLAFLRAVGTIYRASGRTTPIMDALAVHPYPNPNASPPPPPARAAYDDPDFFGLAQLDRVKQAVHDAFAGTAQPTTLGGLKLVVDEFGYQSDTSASGAYSGAESSPVVSDDLQATYYRDAIALTACDTDVSDVLLFHLIDESTRSAGPESGGWQSGLVRPSGDRKPAYEAVKAAIATGCTGAPVAWAPPAAGDDSDLPTPTSRDADPLETALARAKAEFEALPALATDGSASDLLSLPSGDAALEAAARTLAGSFQASGNYQYVTLPRVFWSLPATFKEAVLWKAVTLVFPPSCQGGRTCVLVDRQDFDIWDAYVRLSSRAYATLEICWLGNTGRLCKYRTLMHATAARRPSPPTVRLVATGSGSARAGARATGSMKVVRRPAGVYVTLIAVRSRGDTSKATLVRLRPFVVRAATPIAGPAAKKATTRTVKTATASPAGAAQASSPPAQR